MTAAKTLEEAQIAKLEAEAEAIRARMAREEVRAAKNLAGAAAKAKTAELDLTIKTNDVVQSQIAVKKAQRDEALVLTQGLHTHEFSFYTGIEKGSVGACIERMNQWDVIEPNCDMTITFNSPGGSVIDGMALFDYIRFMQAKGHKVTIIGLGMVASMAGILLEAATWRVMAKGSWLLIHEVSFSAGGKLGEVEDEVKFGQRLKEQAATIFVERSGGKLTRSKLEAMWRRKDCWLDAEEAFKLGLIDEIR